MKFRGIFWLIAAVLVVLCSACGSETPATSQADSVVDNTDSDRTRNLEPVAAEDEESDESSEPDEAAETTEEDVTTDPEVAEEVVERVETECQDDLDNDNDGETDCEDSDCEGGCEICTDLQDNDGDLLIDCLDPDCGVHPSCPELCANGIDDDSDFATDCDDTECSNQPRCTEDPTPLEEYEFSDRWSFMTRIQYPTNDTPCCDFDEDGEPDLENRLPMILGIIPDYDEQLNINAVINDGSLNILLEWLDFPDDIEEGGAASFNVFRATPTSPPCECRYSWETPPCVCLGSEVSGDNPWNDGQGLFQLTPDGFDELGPRVRFRDAEVDGTVLRGGPSTLNMSIPIAQLGIDLNVLIYDAQIRMELETIAHDDAPDEVRTIPRSVATSSGTKIVGGGELGGYVRGADIMAIFNDGADECACAGGYAEGAAPPLIQYGERVDFGRASFFAECQWEAGPYSPDNVNYRCGLDSSSMCPRLAELCLLVEGLPLFLDVDTNKNEAADAVSVGLYFDLVGAHLDEPPVSETD